MSDQNQPLRPTRSNEPVPFRAADAAPLPPHPLDKRWYAHVDGKNFGPYTGHEIRHMVDQGQILETDFLCPEGGNAWVQAKAEPLLGSMFRARALAQPQFSTVTTPNGGTVVQITNTMPHPNFAAGMLLEGPAGAKSPGIALLLSLLICGVGQMYNGQVGKGVAFLFGCIFAWLILLGWVVWIWSMVDAYQTAKMMNFRYQQRMMAGLA